MADFSELGGGQRYETQGAVTSGTSNGTTCTGGAANTKGSWVQLVASTPFDAAAIIVFADTVVLGQMALTDIGIGAAGSEVVLIPNLLLQGGNPSAFAILCPVGIPAGTRLAARTQSVSGAQGCDVAVTLIAATGALEPASGGAATYGVNTATSRGVLVDSGGTANTKGSWQQLTAATSRAHQWLSVLTGSAGLTESSGSQALVDIGIGAGGSEQVILDNLPVGFSVSGSIWTPQVTGPLPIQLPAGVRLAVRAQSSVTSSSDRKFDLTVIAFD